MDLSDKKLPTINSAAPQPEEKKLEPLANPGAKDRSALLLPSIHLAQQRQRSNSNPLMGAGIQITGKSALL
jgi:hypothetical protein